MTQLTWNRGDTPDTLRNLLDHITPGTPATITCNGTTEHVTLSRGHRNDTYVDRGPRHSRIANRDGFPSTRLDSITIDIPGPPTTLHDMLTNWARHHHITVPAGQAALTLPSTSIGLDGPRVTVAVCLLIAAVCALTSALIAKEIRQP